jgi:hypothetical protein
MDNLFSADTVTAFVFYDGDQVAAVAMAPSKDVSLVFGNRYFGIGILIV